MISFIFDNIWGILIAFGAIYLYVKIKKKFNYFADRGMPHVQSSWIDLLKSLSVKNLFDKPLELYKQKSGGDSPYIGYFTFLKPSILVMDSDLAERVLIKDFSHFHDHGLEFDMENNPLAGHLFNMNGDQWRTLRHKLVPTFTSGKLRGMVPIMEMCADDLIKDIKQDSDLRQDTNLKDLFKIYSLAVITRCAFGIEPESVKDPNCEFRRVMKKILTPSLLSLIKTGLLIAVPSLSRLMKIKIFPKDVEDFFLSFTRQSFEMRQKSGVKTNDFIQLLLELKEKGHIEVDAKDLEQDEKENIESLKANPPTAKLELTEELLMAQVFVFLAAGYENTAYLVAITMYVLSKHPEIQTRVREEVKEAKEKHKSMDYQAIRDMKLLEACVDEALRLHAPVPTLLRECTKTYTLSDGMKIDKGTSVTLPARSFHHDAKYWSNPEEFNPDRFLNKENIQPGTYMPFGDGPRICIAQRMALLVTKLMVAKLVENFQLLPSPKTKEPIDVQTFGLSDVEGGLWGSLDVI